MIRGISVIVSRRGYGPWNTTVSPPAGTDHPSDGVRAAGSGSAAITVDRDRKAHVGFT